jgi:preprotein translocase subunit YajC
VYTSMALLHHALAATSGSTKKSGSPLPFVILIGLFGVAYFAFLRPARNRQRAAATARKKTAEVGDEVTTTAGLIATVVAVDDEAITLEVAPGVHCRYLPAAILRVNGDEEVEPEPDAPDASTHEVIDDPDAPSRAADPADDHPDESAPA